jgi:hypothetical protein
MNRNPDEYIYHRTMDKSKTVIVFEETLIRTQGNNILTTVSPVGLKDTLNLPDELVEQLAEHVPDGYCLVIAHREVSRKF